MKKLIFRKITIDTSIFFVGLLIILSSIVWTIQAVNYLDFITEDGHGFKVYFFYTLFNFPKIIHRILPFVFFISVFYTIIKYEKNNELNIFWTYGISKKKILDQFLVLSLLLMLFQVFLGSYISPKSQLKAREYLKNSNVDFISSLIKKGKFLPISKNITIFVENKNNNNQYENVFLDDSTNQNSKIIISNLGALIEGNKQKFFNFESGKIVDITKNDIKVFEFSEINFLLDNLNSNTIVKPKIQELSTIILLSCLDNIKFLNIKDFKCDSSINKEIARELIKRIYKPIYIPIIALFCCLLLININKKKNKFLIFVLTFLILILSETSLRYSTASESAFGFYLVVPLLIFCITYFIILKILKI